ncbi:unnamed protein product, partial [Meganyctiphanes norvegica]
MQFEDILEEVGQFGLYQRLLCFLLIPFTTGLVGIVYYTQLFVLTAPRHQCHLSSPGSFFDNQQDVFYNHVAHLVNTTEQGAPALEPFTCHQYTSNISEDFSYLLNTTSLDQLPVPGVTCTNGWEYNNTQMFPTFTSESDWVCDAAWQPYMVVSMFWVGNIIGSWIFGVLTDLIGRRIVTLVSLCLYGVAGVASVFVRNFYGFLVLRTLVGVSHHTVTHLPFVLVVEYCGVGSRTIPLLTIMISYTMASLITPVLAWAIWDWQILLAVSSAPALLIIFAYRWIPESASWQIIKGRSDDARNQLEKVAITNKRQVPYYMFNQLVTEMQDQQDSVKSNVTILTVRHYPILRMNIFLVLVIWMLACLCFYGHCQNTSNLGSDVFSSYFMGALVEVPSWGVPYIIHRFGRRIPLVTCFMLSGAASIVYTLIPAEQLALSICFGMLGRMFIAGAYYITLQYGPEIFPTVIRGQGVALCETLGGIAIFTSPMVVYLGEVQRPLPMLIMGSLSVLAGVATFLLPETSGVALPQTLAKGEAFLSKQIPTCF